MTAGTTYGEYKGFAVCGMYTGGVYEITILKPDKSVWCKFLSESTELATRRAFELIDSEAGRAIIEDMKVTKSRDLRIGDIVATNNPSIRGKTYTLGVVEKIENGVAFICLLRKDSSNFYAKGDMSYPYKLEKLHLLENREKWLEIKRDLERATDGDILIEWINNL